MRDESAMIHGTDTSTEGAPEWILGTDLDREELVGFRFHDENPSSLEENQLSSMIVADNNIQARRVLIHSMLRQLTGTYSMRDLILHIVGPVTEYQQYARYSAVQTIVDSTVLDQVYVEKIVKVADELFFEVKDRQEMLPRRRYPTVVILVDEADRVLDPANLDLPDDQSREDFLSVIQPLQYMMKSNIHSVITLNRIAGEWEDHVATLHSAMVEIGEIHEHGQMEITLHDRDVPKRVLQAPYMP